MPHTRRSRYRPGSDQLGGKASFDSIVAKGAVRELPFGRGNRWLGPNINVPHGGSDNAGEIAGYSTWPRKCRIGT